MFWVVLVFLFLSLLFYCLLAGADFGAGVLEYFVDPKNRPQHEELINRAMGPVWEANHIWLIILIVILFNGFPQVYTQLSIYFHLPLMLMLIGIVFRGCAFAFRHYDAVKDKAHIYYSLAFSWASILTPIMFGMIIGGTMKGVDPQANHYYGKFVAPWFNLFSFALGLFVLSLFTYLASVYLIGESNDAVLKQRYIKSARATNILVMVMGAAVFCVNQSLLRQFFTNELSLICFLLATIQTLVFWINVGRGRTGAWNLRFIAGVQVTLVLLAWLSLVFPNVLHYTDGTNLSLLSMTVPQATINILGWSLIGGSALFLPILWYLMKTFKFSS